MITVFPLFYLIKIFNALLIKKKIKKQKNCTNNCDDWYKTINDNLMLIIVK